jgi:hypothetical protein
MKYSNNKELTHHPTAMEQHGFENVHEAMQHFFSFFTIQDSRKFLWEFYREWITGEGATATTGQERGLGLFFYEQLEVILEACYMLQKKRRQKKRKCFYIPTKTKSQ